MSTGNTGSKGALVTATVLSIITAVALAIWSIISYVNMDRATKDLDSERAKYAAIAPNPQSTSIAQLKEVQAVPERGLKGMSLIDVAIKQRDELQTFLAGAGTSDIQAKAAVTTAIEAAKVSAGNTTLSDATVVDAINGLTQQLTAIKVSNTQLTSDLAAARKKVEDTLATTTKQMETNQSAVADAQKQAQEAVAGSESFRQEKDGLVTAAQQATVDATQVGEESVRNLQTQVAQLRRQIQNAERERDQARNQLASLRVPVDQILRQADGKIIRTPGGDRVLIDIGSGAGIAPGLTFEIFDPLGVPQTTGAPGEDDTVLKGKASIEIIRVQPGSSEARIIRTSPGASIREGDLAVNLVYDRNIKYNFVVYGKFNLDRRGDSSVRDGDALKRLVSQWGAKVVDQVNIDTDFLLLGDEPLVPAFSQDDLQDPIKARQFEEASRDLEAYNDVRSKAQSLSVPILNQTRFLYLIGYYDESSR